MEVLLQIVAPYFVAGIVAEDDRVTQAAPIVKYMIGWTMERAVTYATAKQWKVFRVSSPEALQPQSPLS